MMSKVAYLSVALLFVAAPALAQIAVQDPTPLPPPAKVKAKSDLDKVVCRSQEDIGSRLERHQVCMTKQQWWTYEQEAKQKVHDIQMIGYTSN